MGSDAVECQACRSAPSRRRNSYCPIVSRLGWLQGLVGMPLFHSEEQTQMGLQARVGQTSPSLQSTGGRDDGYLRGTVQGSRDEETLIQADHEGQGGFWRTQEAPWGHYRNEEKILYDLIVTKKVTGTDSMEAVEEHRIIDLLMLGLEDFPPDHERWPIKVEVLQEYTEHHF